MKSLVLYAPTHALAASHHLPFNKCKAFNRTRWVIESDCLCGWQWCSSESSCEEGAGKWYVNFFTILIKKLLRTRKEENIMELPDMKFCAFKSDFHSKHVSLGWKVGLWFPYKVDVSENAHNHPKGLIKTAQLIFM